MFNANVWTSCLRECSSRYRPNNRCSKIWSTCFINVARSAKFSTITVLFKLSRKSSSGDPGALLIRLGSILGTLPTGLDATKALARTTLHHTTHPIRFEQ